MTVQAMKPKWGAPRGDFRRAFKVLTDELVTAEVRARASAATKATAATRAAFTPLRPQNVPGRAGRAAKGRMINALEWKASSKGVAFDIAGASASHPFWIIQEIGTGQRAAIKSAGVTNPKGRPSAGATYSRSVKSQRGRLIPGSLAFGTGPSGTFTRPGARGNQQLYLRAQLKGAPVRPNALVISREIRGQHMVRIGGQTGFREYRKSVIAAARQAFGGRRRP